MIPEYPMTPKELRAAYAAFNEEISAIKFNPAAQADLLQRIMEYQYLNDQIDSLEKMLAERRAQFRELQEFTIPEVLRECGIWGDRWDFPPDWYQEDENGNPAAEYIKISEEIHVSIPPDRQYDCEYWLKANGAADKVSRKEVIAIHAGSLKAIVRRALSENSGEVCVEARQRIINLFKVHQFQKAEIKRSKSKNQKQVE